MINVINNTEQTVAANQNVLFSTNRLKTGCGIRHDAGSGLVRINKGGLYHVVFNGNVVATAASTTATVAIEIDGEPVNSATAIDTLSAVGNTASMSIDTIICVPNNCCTNISVGNESTVSLTIQNASLIVERIG